LMESLCVLLLILTGIAQAQTPQQLDGGVVGRDYEYLLNALSGTGRLFWEVTGGNLPPGINIDPLSGRLSGRPTRAGVYTFELKVTDESSPRQEAKQSFKIEITGGLAITLPTPDPQALFNPATGRTSPIPPSPPPPSRPAPDEGAGPDSVTI